MLQPSPKDGTSIPLLQKKIFQQKTLRAPTTFGNKSIVIVLLWQFSAGLLYNLFVRPTRYIQTFYIDSALMLSLVFLLIFMLSPLAGYVADVKLSRIKVLRYGTVVISISLLTFLVIGIFLLFEAYHFDTEGKILVSAMALSLICYIVGHIMLLSNIVQFGTDQLRDAPTRYSLYYIQAYLWIDSVGYLITSTTYLPGREIIINVHVNLIAIERYRCLAIDVAIILSIGLNIVVLYLATSKKYSALFLSDYSVHNPYKLVYNVLRYAVSHNKPEKPSAFTFCDDVRPTRLDFGKLRYGGPFTTEQVEDVKVIFNILIVLISCSPIFLLEIVVAFSFKDHVMSNHISVPINDPIQVFFLDSGIIVSLFILILIPLFHCTKMATPLKYAPNLFKKIGIAMCIIIIQLLVLLLYNTISYDSSVNLAFFYTYCNNNATYDLNKSFVSIPSNYVSIFQQILFAVFQVLLYTSVYEFICCQSPQYMKGLLFGLFYALRAFNQFFGAATMYLFIHHWYSTSLSCGSAYYIFTLCIAVVSLLVYINVARKYKYRKRDDICNIYKFAEDYYSNIQ